ncbi:MAG: DUF2911 domain-containing protein [Gemmatimonadales bacterium]
MRFTHYCLAAALLAGGAPSLAAQIRASERATVSQVVDGTRITVDYSRPRARGRAALFGGEVKWNEVWTPGANDATTLEIDRDIKLDGHPVPKGIYSVWLVVREQGPWTMVLDPRAKLFHMAHPDSAMNQIRYPVNIETGPQTEVLTFTFPEIRPNGATLMLRWGVTQVSFRIDVTPTYNMVIDRQKVGPYLGKYAFEWTQKEAGDTVALTYTVAFKDSVLVGEWSPRPWPEAGPMILLPIKEGWFIPAFLENGEIRDVEKDMVLEFPRTKSGQKAAGFEVRGTGDSLWATAKRQ